MLSPNLGTWLSILMACALNSSISPFSSHTRPSFAPSSTGLCYIWVRHIFLAPIIMINKHSTSWKSRYHLAVSMRMPGIKGEKKLVGILSKVEGDRAKGKSHREFKLFVNDLVTWVHMVNSTVNNSENFAEVCAHQLSHKYLQKLTRKLLCFKMSFESNSTWACPKSGGTGRSMLKPCHLQVTWDSISLSFRKSHGRTDCEMSVLITGVQEAFGYHPWMIEKKRDRKWQEGIWWS